MNNLQESYITLESFFNDDKKVNSWKDKLFSILPFINKNDNYNLISLSDDGKYLIIKGINVKLLFDRIMEKYGEKSITKIVLLSYNNNDLKKYLKKKIPKNKMKIEYLYVPIFFALELSIIFNILAEEYKQLSYLRIANKIYEISWLSKSDSKIPEKLNIKNLNNIKYELLPHQREFIEKYPTIKSKYNLNGIINSFEQGLGKTLTAIALSECIGMNRVYIVCPNSLKENWANEIRSYYDKYSTDTDLWKREVVICTDNQAIKRINTAKFVIVNNESIPKIFPFIKSGKNMLIIDESHNFRNLSGERVNALMELKDRIDSKDILVMSGTPIKAIPNEIVPALLMIDPMFTTECAEIYTKCFNFNSVEAMEIIKVRFGQIIYRKTKKELSLPTKIIEDLKVRVSGEQKFLLNVVREETIKRFKQIYHEKTKNSIKLEKELLDLVQKYSIASQEENDYYFEWVLSIIENNTYADMHDVDKDFVDTFLIKYVKPNISENNLKRLEELERTYLRMKQSAMGIAIGEILTPRRREMYMKMFSENKDLFINMIINNTRKTIIFTQILDVAKSIARTLNENGVMTGLIIGGEKNRQFIIDQFKQDDNMMCLVATSQTLSTGVTLVEANQMFFFAPPWRSTDFDQACDRIHRIGQTVDVHIYNVTLDTEKKNLSDRMNEILTWSSSMFNSSITETEKLLE